MAARWIAEERVVFVHPNGERRAGRIAIGRPVQRSPDEAECTVFLEGLDPRGYPISGATTLQALLLGAQFLGYGLHAHLSRGGVVVDPESGERIPLEALFGPLLRRPVVPPAKPGRPRARRRATAPASSRSRPPRRRRARPSGG